MSSILTDEPLSADYDAFEAAWGEEASNHSREQFELASAALVHPEKIWRQLNGAYIRISSMDDNHLKNTIAMLRRNQATHLPVYQGLIQEQKLRNKDKKEQKTMEAKTGLWEKTSQAGKLYYSGKITVEGKEYWANMFVNEQKTPGDNKPDMNLILKPKV